MSIGSHKPAEFVVGDLVYYTGDLSPLGAPYVRGKKNPKRVGIIVKISPAGFHTYNVYWLKDALVSNHVANHLELVYNV